MKSFSLVRRSIGLLDPSESLACTDPVVEGEHRGPSAAVVYGNTRVQLKIAAIIALSLINLVQIASPLRLNTDATTLLSMAQSAHEGRGFTEEGRKTLLPIAYPLVVWGLSSAGVACSSGFVALNVIAFAVGLSTFWRIARSYWNLAGEAAINAILLTLLSFAAIKHLPIPMTEFVFMALGLLAIERALASQRSRSHAGLQFFLAVTLAMLATAVRTVGVALFPALLWSAWHTPGLRRRLPTASKLIAILLVVGAIGAGLLLRTSYFSFTAEHVGFRAWLPAAALARLRDAGELVLNVPYSRLAFTGGAGLILMSSIGAVASIMVGAGFAVRSYAVSTVEVYVFAYAALMLVWPYQDVRFWIPVLPFMVVLAQDGARRLAGRHWQRAAVLYVAMFAATGVTALAYSARITLSGSRFADLYGTDDLRATYQTAYGRTVTGRTPAIPRIVALIDQYDACPSRQ